MIGRLLGLQGSIARDVWPKGATLACRECKASRRITTEQCAEYLAHGWPKCCGVTMTVDDVSTKSQKENVG